MLISSFKSLFMVGSTLSGVACGAAVANIDLTVFKTCDQVLAENFIDLATFRRWNPSIAERCFLTVGKSYCVEAFAARHHYQQDTSTTSSSSTARTTTTTSAPGNGIPTPTPLQPNVVGNCDKFYLVRNGDTCDSIAAAHGITSSMFRTWNANVGGTCGGLWRDAYACVSIVGVGNRPASDFPEKVWIKYGPPRELSPLWVPMNWILRALGAWPSNSEQYDAANTIAYFWPTTNNQLTLATSRYVSGLLAGPRPSISSTNQRRDNVEDLIASWGWGSASNETVEEVANQYWRRPDSSKQLEARDLYDDVLSISCSALRTWSIMRPDVLGISNEGVAWWSGTPQSLSREFATAWQTGSDEQNCILQWFISTLERTGRP
ncbi:LysM domain-containing protein [Paramyrothecium foliicola]|nr:LysM domain-containing protein [Paramyrothecium foliicola]